MKKIGLTILLCLIAVAFIFLNNHSDSKKTIEEIQKVTILIEKRDGEVIPLQVELADRPEKQNLGLAGRDSLSYNEGMLFIFQQDRVEGFWMKNTKIALSIAFIDSSSTILEIQDMNPCYDMPCPIYWPVHPYRYALEVNQGWFRDQKVEKGDKLIWPSDI
ncbi:DUF192 domain-containing protein [Heliorestis acidaminivorans]|uniref:DUF192 domain-containing protein n=1 Tax=Heliorestis acidaminivorans TaxID=553427 RepID=A0A6I0F5Y9_9FIRM|nr:DUF192 domain-containing protein [Heliorestis acidaminivorans]KAB2954247.1 DUF192 domain-containing protein [Heliorestis acidaminivorans]